MRYVATFEDGVRLALEGSAWNRGNIERWVREWKEWREKVSSQIVKSSQRPQAVVRVEEQ